MIQLPRLESLLDFHGKCVLITGSGIGRTMAYRFAEAGAALELTDRGTNA